MSQPVLWAVLFLACAAAGCSSTSKPADTPESRAKVNVVQHLSKRLNDPESYKEISWGELTPVSGCPHVTHYIRHEYRAKNKFGGYVPAADLFLMTGTHNVFVVVSEEDMALIRRSRRFQDASIEEVIRNYADPPKEE